MIISFQDAIEKSDEPVEPHPLWEYPGRALSQPFKTMSLDLVRSLKYQAGDCNGQVQFEADGCFNAIALWMDWDLDSETTVSGGPTASVQLGRQVEWDRHSKQGVYFVKEPAVVTGSHGQILHYRVSLIADTGEFKFHFSLQ